jgi:hypothetical protein
MIIRRNSPPGLRTRARQMIDGVGTDDAIELAVAERQLPHVPHPGGGALGHTQLASCS